MMITERQYPGMKRPLRILDALEQSVQQLAEQPAGAVKAVKTALQGLRVALQEAQRHADGQQERISVLQSLLRHTKTQLAYLDPKMRFVEVNPAYVEGCGYARQDLIGRNHFDLFPNAENQAIFERVVQTGEPVEYVAKPFEFPERPELGTTYWDWTLQPDLDERGQVQGLVLSLIDVTERERSRQEREQRLERERRLLQISEQVLGETTMRGLLQAVVDVARDLTDARIGVSGHGYAGGAFRVGVTSRKEDLPPCPPGEKFDVQRGGVYLRIFEGGKTLRLTQQELEAHPAWWGLPDGHASLRGLLGAPLLDRSGQPVGLIMLSDKQQGEFTAQDEALLAQLAALASLGLLHITAREQAERRAAELEAAFAAIPDGIVIYSAQGQIMQTNAPARAILGYSESQAATTTTERLAGWRLQDEEGHPLAPGDFPLLQAMRGQTVHDRVLRARRPGDESESWFAVSAAPVKDLAGQVVSVVGSFRDITERELARAERERLLGHVAQQEARLRAIIDNAPEGIVVADREGRIVLTNRIADELYGRDVPFLEDVDSHRKLMLSRRNGTPYEPRELPLTRSALDGESVRGEEIKITWPDGQERMLLVNSAPVYGDDGQINGAVGLLQDITHLITLQRQLQRSTGRLLRLRDMDQAILAAQSGEIIATIGLNYLRQLVQCTHASIALLDAEGQQTRILASETETSTPLELARQESLTQISYVQLLRAGEVRVIEDLSEFDGLEQMAQQLLGVTGMQACAHVPLHVKGQLLGSLNLGWDRPGRPSDEDLEIARDVADQVAIGIQQARLYQQLERQNVELEQQVARRTAALAASRARLQAIFESAPSGIALLDEEDVIVQDNRALSRVLGCGARGLVGRPLVSFVEADDVAEFSATLDKARSQPSTHQRRRLRMVREDQQVRWASITMAPVRIEAHRPGQVLVMVEDITEEKRAQEQLIQAEKLALTGRLAASVAHEINNPLQSVIGCLSLVEEAAASGDDFGEYLQVARDELRRAADIIARLRDLHRPVKDTEKEPVQINELLQHVVRLTQKRADDSNVQVSWAPDESLPDVMLVRNRLQQVFLNLFLNGLDAMPEGGRLEVSTRRTCDPDGLEVAFNDSGPGIDADVQPTLFEPFQTTKPGGLGLGLYVSRQIVEDHGGHIDAISKRGKGSTFTVWLPG